MNVDLRTQLGPGRDRIDGVAKVTGAARYASDEPVAGALFGYVLVSRIARGSIGRMDLSAARAVPGVIDIVTHENIGTGFKPAKGPDGGPTTTTLESDKIEHDGQFIGLIVAESYEAAREAANKVRIDYVTQPPSASFDSPAAIPVKAMPRPRSRPPTSKYRSAIRPPPSTTTQSNCSPSPVPGTAII